MSEKYQQMQELLKSMETDIEKFYVKGQSAAGTRLRKKLSELRTMAKAMRDEIQEIKKSRKA
jgi:DNA-binding protein YbaB